MEPELWVTTKRVDEATLDEDIRDSSLHLMATENRWLRRVPFDEAVERMTAVKIALFEGKTTALRIGREDAAALLRAAVGGEGQ